MDGLPGVRALLLNLRLEFLGCIVGKARLNRNRDSSEKGDDNEPGLPESLSARFWRM
jgi:hypothetical protein